jgi:hypothetical protein
MVKLATILAWFRGYTKIRDALVQGLKTEIERSTVADILKEAGIEPAPEREKKRTWRRFMKMHWGTLYSNRDSWRRIADPGAGPARGRINAIFRM